MVELEKCGSSLADLHNARGVGSKYLSLHFDLWQGKHSVSHVLSSMFIFSLIKTTHFYLMFFSFIFILFLYYYFNVIFIILVFCEGSGGFRVGSGWFRVVPGGSG